MFRKKLLFLLFLISLAFIPSFSQAQEAFELPASLKIIGEEAFSGTSIKKVILPKSVTRVENGAFANNTELESIQINHGAVIQTNNTVGFIRNDVLISNPARNPDHLFAQKGIPEEAAAAEVTGKERESISCRDQEQILENNDRPLNIKMSRARKKADGKSHRPQERAEIHPIQCHFP